MTFLKQSLFILTGLICNVFAQSHYTQPINLDSSVGFSVEYHDTYKVLTNLITNERYALVCCNNSLSNFTTGYNAVVNTPLNNVGVSNELDSLPFFELLSLSSNVKSASPSANVTSPCFDGISDGPNSTIPVIDAIFTSQSQTAAINTTQYITVSSSTATLSPIQQSAWIVYIGHFFEIENFAYNVYTEINYKYACHKSNLANAGSKNIAWTTFDVVANAWTLHYDTFTSNLIADAGMTLINNQSSTFTNTLDFQHALNNADYVIDDTPAANLKTDFAFGDWLTAAGLTPSSSAAYVANKNVWRTDGLVNPNGFSDWPIRRSARPDLALSDIIHMVYNTYEPTYNMTWFRAFAQMARPTFVSNLAYPSCTDAVARIDLNMCSINTFSPNGTVATGPAPSTSPHISHGLSTGAKVGIAIGVVAGCAALAVIGTFAYKRQRSQRTGGGEGTFVKMNDM